MKRFLFCLTFLLAAAVSVSAEDKVYLKNGRVMTGEIFSQTRYSVKMNIDGIPRVFYMDEINHVEAGKEAEPPAVEKVAEAVSGTATAAQEPLTDEKKALILEFLEVTGTQAALQSSILAGAAKIPPEERQRFERYMQADEILAQLVPVYGKRFTTDELKELLAFYRSPVGNKMKTEMPQIMKESIQVMVKYFGDLKKEETAPSGTPMGQDGRPKLF